MTLLDSSKPPSQFMLRWFGVSAALFLLLLAYVVPQRTLQVLFVSVALVMAVIYYCVPRTQPAMVRTWQVVLFPVAFLVGHFLLACTYFLLVTSMGWIARRFGYDPMRTHDEFASSKEDALETAWVSHDSVKDSDRYFKQF